MSDRSKYIKNYSELQNPPNRYPGSDEPMAESARFGKAFGFQRLGINHVLLRPGRRSSYPHAESTEEEFIYVIEGNPQAWINGHLHDLKPGDGVGFPPGDGVCHTFINNTDKDVRLLVVGDTDRADNKIYYPYNLERKSQVKDAWWADVPKQEMGPHKGLPDKK